MISFEHLVEFQIWVFLWGLLVFEFLICILVMFNFIAWLGGRSIGNLIGERNVDRYDMLLVVEVLLRFGTLIEIEKDDLFWHFFFFLF